MKLHIYLHRINGSIRLEIINIVVFRTDRVKNLRLEESMFCDLSDCLTILILFSPFYLILKYKCLMFNECIWHKTIFGYGVEPGTWFYLVLSVYSPLDISFMALLNAYHEQEVRKWLISNPRRSITIYEVTMFYKVAFLRNYCSRVQSNWNISQSSMFPAETINRKDQEKISALIKTYQQYQQKWKVFYRHQKMQKLSSTSKDVELCH
ncbi:hypothetical protein WN51_10051 [Melipona quadrifasciata]|uniref:Uncharacterized protein n=1 Tax=Melipona quadrifasciata TaxID=166423 RepID=A0A0M9ACM3_9HYME|nr:hypothetical protein WN51_10051 [Melipona quadrifasciata]